MNTNELEVLLLRSAERIKELFECFNIEKPEDHSGIAKIDIKKGTENIAYANLSKLGEISEKVSNEYPINFKLNINEKDIVHTFTKGLVGTGMSEYLSNKEDGK